MAEITKGDVAAVRNALTEVGKTLAALLEQAKKTNRLLGRVVVATEAAMPPDVEDNDDE